MELLNGLLVIITAVYAFLTYRILVANQRSVAQMERQTEELTRPYVIAHVVIGKGGGYELEIKNFGKTAAYKVTFELDKDFPAIGGSHGDTLRSIPLIRYGIPVMAPDFEISYCIDKPDSDLPNSSRFSITVGYENSRAKKYTEIFQADLEAFSSSKILVDRQAENLRDIAKELAGIRLKLK